MIAVTVCATTPVAAQVTGTVYGTIKDEQGSVVPGATLVLTSETRGTKSASAITNADVVMIGSYVPQGTAIGEWVTKTAQGVTAFYDIDTPVTLAQLARGKVDYVSRALVPRYDLYLSFTGGPTLDFLEERYGACKVQGYARTLRIGEPERRAGVEVPLVARLLVLAGRLCQNC